MTTSLRTSIAASLLASSAAAWAQPAIAPSSPSTPKTQAAEKTLAPVNVTEAQGREATGVRLMSLDSGQSVASVAKVYVADE